MWLNKENKKPASLKRLLGLSIDHKNCVPENLEMSCIVTYAMSTDNISLVLELERLSSETDDFIVEKKLQQLLSQFNITL